MFWANMLANKRKVYYSNKYLFGYHAKKYSKMYAVD